MYHRLLLDCGRILTVMTGMKVVLSLVVVIATMSTGTAVEKPGLCSPLFNTSFGACVIACDEDSHCAGFQKCCLTGCGQMCQDPVCPAGVAAVKCPQSLCRFSECPNAPDAACRIDSCGRCRVEHYNKTTWEKIQCTNRGQHLCERMRNLGSRYLLGRYVPRCTREGKFASPQQMGSVLFCVDEETGIPDYTTRKSVGQIKEMKCPKKAGKTACHLAHEAALKLPAIGRFVPSCKEDGSYEAKQCHGSTGFCWCVDEKGREWFGSRKRGKVECPKDMCPGGVEEVEDCDPMICAAATCHGYDQSEVSCRINPCGQCEAEFLDKYNRKATCKSCANKRAELLKKSHGRLIGQFVPQCKDDGNYEEVQCWGSVGRCWCVDSVTGVQVDGTMTRGTPNCERPNVPLLLGFKRPDTGVSKTPQPVCPNGMPMMLCLRPFCQWSRGCAANVKAKCRVNPCKLCAVEYFDEKNNLVDCNGEMSECQLRRADALSSKYIGLQPVGRFIPQCDKDGNYSRVQCWGSTGYCWCVDPTSGVEREQTRTRGKPNCTTKTREEPLVKIVEVKSGRCPTIQPSDTHNTSCAKDNDCPGKKKCCQVYHEKTCLEPSEEQLACPSGSPFLLCLHHCQLATCPAYPRAKCTVDPCRMCKVEFKDVDGNIVNCSAKLTPCQLQRAKSPALLGSYRPQCDKDGGYKPIQCHGSVGYCWCVDENGREIINTRQREPLNCTYHASKKVLSKCQQMRSRAMNSSLLGVKIPQCEGDGSFKKVQTWENYQWCVDENGIELIGTRIRVANGPPKCNQACRPVMCAMYCQYGFRKNIKGCDVRECAMAPVKPGVCPVLDAGYGADMCMEDPECPGIMKCCNGECLKPMPYVKPGYCPAVEALDAGVCISECSSDDHCPGDEKCCANGCSRKCTRPAKELCPNGAPLVMCLRNLCDEHVSCPAHPKAACRMNYCGHCSFEFVLPNGSIADCGKTDAKVPQDKLECAEQNKTMYFCPSSLCDDKICSRNPKATCRVPALSCDCAVKFYDKNGEEVECLTECQRKRKEMETGRPLIGAYKPQCEADGTYSQVQCHGSTGYCWCVSKDGTKWPGTDVRGNPDCSNKKPPSIRSVRVKLSFDTDFDRVKDAVDDFKKVLVNHMKALFGIHPQQMQNIKVTSGSIVVEFELIRHENGDDISNVSSQLRGMVLEGEFVIDFGGERIVAKPESFTATARLSSDRNDNNEDGKDVSVLAVVLGVVFGVLAVAMIVGALIMIRRRSLAKNRGMSVNTCDSSHPMKESF